MSKKQRRVQLILLVTGCLLFFLTYLLYPNLNDKIIKNTLEEKEIKVGEVLDPSDLKSTTFQSLEFKGFYDLDKTFNIKSKEAYINNDEPDVVYMEKMLVTLNLDDGTIIKITSDKGSYNKITYSCFFEENVKASDGSTVILAENIDFVANKSFLQVYNNVELKHISGDLLADKVDYNFETKKFIVSMFEDNSVKMKVIQ